MCRRRSSTTGVAPSASSRQSWRWIRATPTPSAPCSGCSARATTGAGWSPSWRPSPGWWPIPAERLALWREMALLLEGKLEDREAAAAAWRRVSEADPLNREAVSALDRLYTALGKFENLAFALELRRAQEGQSPQGREATFRLAQLRREKLQDFGGALQLLGQVLSEDPGHTADAGPARGLGPLARPGQPERAGHARSRPGPLRPARPPRRHPGGADGRRADRREDPPRPGDPLHPGAGHGPAPAGLPRRRPGLRPERGPPRRPRRPRAARPGDRQLRGAGRAPTSGSPPRRAGPIRTRWPGSGAPPSSASTSPRATTPSGTGRRCSPRPPRTARRSTRWASSTSRPRTPSSSRR